MVIQYLDRTLTSTTQVTPGAALSAKGLEKRWSPSTGVFGIDLDVSRGEVVGVVGPNGAGKTTLMSMIAGLCRPDAGAILVDGLPDPSLPATRARVGLAPQALALYEELTCEENLAFFGELYGLFGDVLRARVSRSLAFADLEPRRRDRVSALSGGMQRRLNLACALLHDPVLLLFDEPTAGVDPQSRGHLQRSVAALRDEGRGVVYSTHYLEEVEKLCDRVVVVDHGRVVARGTVDEMRALAAAGSLEEAFLSITGAELRE